jgi:RHS repeat-associated protein
LDNLTSVTQQGLAGTYCNGNLVTRCFSYDSLGRLSHATNPESGTNSYKYDDNGNLTQRILDDGASPATATMTYDALNRISSKSYSGSGSSTPAVKYCYDGQIYNGSETCTTGLTTGKIGQLIVVHNAVSMTSYSSFDALGRVTTSSQTTGGTTYQFSYGYNRVGLSSVTYPSLRTINYTYDAAGRISGVGGGATVDPAYPAYPIAYSPHGAITSMKLRNGLIESRSYNSRLQAAGIAVGIPGNLGSVFSMGLYYCPSYGSSCANNNGNVQTILLPNHTQQYGYDGANRLVSMQEGSAQQSWAYDNLGNRWVTSSSGLPQSVLLPTNALGYNDKSQLTVQGAQYDGRGNQTGIDGNSYAYDGENRLATVNGVNNYEYDGDGRRVRKTAGGVTTTYVYDAMGQMAAEYGTEAVTAGCSPCYVTTDHLGSTRLLTNASGNMVERHDYMPFGEELFAGYGNRTTEQGFPASPLTNKADMLFTGKERDNESGLDYFGARYYSGSQGRFTSTDPVLISNQRLNHPQQWNQYSYSINNPLAFTDPSGREVHILDEEALKRILMTLPEDLRDRIQLDQRGFIDKNIINDIISEDANFLDLKELINLKDILEVSTASNFNADGHSYEFFYESIQDIIKDLNSKGIYDVDITGPNLLLGYTFGKADSSTGIARVVVSDGTGKAAGTPAIEHAVTMAEEIYGHALLNLKNMPWEHEYQGKNRPVNDKIAKIIERTRELYEKK